MATIARAPGALPDIEIEGVPPKAIPLADLPALPAFDAEKSGQVRAELAARHVAARKREAIAREIATGEDQEHLLEALEDRARPRGPSLLMAQSRANAYVDQVAAEIVGDKDAEDFAAAQVSACDTWIASRPPKNTAQMMLAKMLSELPDEPAATSTKTAAPNTRARSTSSTSTKSRTASASNASGDPSASSSGSGDDDPAPGSATRDAATRYVPISLGIDLGAALESAVERLDAATREIAELQASDRTILAELADLRQFMQALPSRDELRAHDARAAARHWREKANGSSGNPGGSGPSGPEGVTVDPSAASVSALVVDGRRLHVVAEKAS